MGCEYGFLKRSPGPADKLPVHNGKRSVDDGKKRDAYWP